MDQWLGIKNNEPYETVSDFPAQSGIKPESMLKPVTKQPETVKTFWDEHLKKPEAKLARPEKKKKVPVTSRIKSHYQLIKEEREVQMQLKQSVERLKIDWKRIEAERYNSHFNRKTYKNDRSFVF